MIEKFVAEMRRNLPDHARILLCQFRGSPEDDIKGKWRAKVLDDCGLIDPAANVYLCVSAMRRNDRGEFRRRKENFAGGLLLMIDDLGEGPGSKFPLSTIDPAPPSALVETSPGNFQAIYLFDKLVTDMRLFEALIKAFIDAQFLGKDTGMAGVNRVFRPPAGVNGKAKHNGWRVRMTEWHPERRYSVEQLAKAFGLTLNLRGKPVPRGATVDKAESIRRFIEVRAALRSAGMLKKREADIAGWADVECPWTHEHTAAADNGAAISLPNDENAWQGGFRCHHGACEGRGWRELTEWLAAQQEELLDLINKTAKDWHDFQS